MFYTVYKITNWFNGKIYIGIHKTDDLNDGYMGSGKHLKYAQEKYGLQYFTKEYLAIFDNPDDMYEMESSLVNEYFIERDDTYNIKEGGYGGWNYINNNPQLFLTEKRIASLFENNKKRKEGFLKKYNNDPLFRELVNDNAKKANEIFRLKYPHGAFKGKNHTDETKQKMSQKHKERLQDPTKNSQYGTMWITNGTENKKISKDSDIPEGWYKGRVIKQDVM